MEATEYSFSHTTIAQVCFEQTMVGLSWFPVLNGLVDISESLGVRDRDLILARAAKFALSSCCDNATRDFAQKMFARHIMLAARRAHRDFMPHEALRLVTVLAEAQGIEAALKLEGALSASELQEKFGNAGAAVHYAKSALELARRCGDRFREIGCLTRIGTMGHYTGSVDEALEAFAQAEILSGSDPVSMSFLRNNRGHLYRDMGRFELAESEYAQSLDTCKMRGDMVGAARAHLGFSSLYMAKGNFDAAQRHLDGADSLAAVAGSARIRVSVKGNRVHLLHGQGRVSEALELAAEVLHDAVEAEDSHSVTRTYVLSAELCIELGQFAEAAKQLDQARATGASMSLQSEIAEASLCSAKLERELGNLEASACWALVAEKELTSIGANAKLPEVWIELAKTRLAQRRKEEAAGLAERAHSCAETCRRTLLLAQVKVFLAELCLASGDSARSHALALDSDELFERSGVVRSRDRLQSMLILVEATIALGDLPASQFLLPDAISMAGSLRISELQCCADMNRRLLNLVQQLETTNPRGSSRGSRSL